MHVRRLALVMIFTALFALTLFGQEAVVTLLPYDGTANTLLQEQIKADTTTTHGMLANRVYELQRGQVYGANAIFVVLPGTTLRLRAAAGEGKKPVIYLLETGTGNNPTYPPGYFVRLNGGSVELKDVCVAGFYEWEPERLNTVQGGLIGTTSASESIVVDGCILSNSNGNHIRTDQSVKKVQVSNTIFANMGALTRSNLGAGKGLDLRDVAIDTLTLVNNTFVNYQDRALRHYTTDPTKGPIRYALIDHNTFVNGMGFHGLFSLGNVGNSITITNNLFVDGFALGEDSTDGTRAAEWANTGEYYPNGRSKIQWIFSTPNDTTQWQIRNNFYTISDSGWAFLNDFNFGPGEPLSDHIKNRLGTAADQAFTYVQNFKLVAAPRLMTNMMRWYEDPNGGNKTKNTPSDKFVVALHDYDRRLLEYYHDTLDCAYPTTDLAYGAATYGYPVGDLNWFPTLKEKWENGEVLVGITEQVTTEPTKFGLHQNYPNPFNPVTTITFAIEKSGYTTLSVYNLLGQVVAKPIASKLTVGTYNYVFDAGALPSGVYFCVLESAGKVSVRKMLLLK